VRLGASCLHLLSSARTAARQDARAPSAAASDAPHQGLRTWLLVLSCHAQPAGRPVVELCPRGDVRGGACVRCKAGGRAQPHTCVQGQAALRAHEHAARACTPMQPRRPTTHPGAGAGWRSTGGCAGQAGPGWPRCARAPPPPPTRTWRVLGHAQVQVDGRVVELHRQAAHAQGRDDQRLGGQGAGGA